jgi:hypothetical protein
MDRIAPSNTPRSQILDRLLLKYGAIGSTWFRFVYSHWSSHINPNVSLFDGKYDGANNTMRSQGLSRSRSRRMVAPCFFPSLYLAAPACPLLFHFLVKCCVCVHVPRPRLFCALYSYVSTFRPPFTRSTPARSCTAPPPWQTAHSPPPRPQPHGGC